MPEFEETNPASNAENYTPSKDAKPRSRRRSGGFKKDLSAAPNNSIGEIDPAEALRGERLSGNPAPEPEREPEPEPEREPRKPSQNHKTKMEPETERSQPNPKPSEATLATVKRVEARILERKAKRDARHQARKKERTTGTNSGSKQNTPKKSGGLLASILKLFGLGPKTQTRKNPRRRGPQGGNRRSRGGRGRNPRGSSRRD